MSVVEKGIVLSREGNKVRVQSAVATGTVSPLISLPVELRDDGIIEKGTEVVYVLFPDGTGLVINKLYKDGD